MLLFDSLAKNTWSSDESYTGDFHDMDIDNFASLKDREMWALFSNTVS